MTSYFLPQKRPKILLINFSTKDRNVLVARGYNVERGVVQRPRTTHEGTFWWYYFKSPPYEYDITIYDSDVTSVVVPASPYDRYEKQDDFYELKESVQKGFGLSFIGPEKEREDNLSSSGLPEVKLTDADIRDTRLVFVEPGESGIE